MGFVLYFADLPVGEDRQASVKKYLRGFASLREKTSLRSFLFAALRLCEKKYLCVRLSSRLCNPACWGADLRGIFYSCLIVTIILSKIYQKRINPIIARKHCNK
jgi:hypothetical protein